MLLSEGNKLLPALTEVTDYEKEVFRYTLQIHSLNTVCNYALRCVLAGAVQ